MPHVTRVWQRVIVLALVIVFSVSLLSTLHSENQVDGESGNDSTLMGRSLLEIRQVPQVAPKQEGQEKSGLLGRLVKAAKKQQTNKPTEEDDDDDDKDLKSELEKRIENPGFIDKAKVAIRRMAFQQKVNKLKAGKTPTIVEEEEKKEEEKEKKPKVSFEDVYKSLTNDLKKLAEKGEALFKMKEQLVQLLKKSNKKLSDVPSETKEQLVADAASMLKQVEKDLEENKKEILEVVSEEKTIENLQNQVQEVQKIAIKAEEIAEEVKAKEKAKEIAEAEKAGDDNDDNDDEDEDDDDDEDDDKGEDKDQKKADEDEDEEDDEEEDDTEPEATPKEQAKETEKEEEDEDEDEEKEDEEESKELTKQTGEVKEQEADDQP